MPGDGRQNTFDMIYRYFDISICRKFHIAIYTESSIYRYIDSSILLYVPKVRYIDNIDISIWFRYFDAPKLSFSAYCYKKKHGDAGGRTAKHVWCDISKARYCDIPKLSIRSPALLTTDSCNHAAAGLYSSLHCVGCCMDTWIVRSLNTRYQVCRCCMNGSITTVIKREMAPIGEMAPGCGKRSKKEYLIVFSHPHRRDGTGCISTM